MVFTEEDKIIRHRIANKKWYDDNKEKKTERQKQYYLDHPKIFTIKRWKQQGIIVEDDDWEGLYQYFIKETNCWICNKVYNKDINMDRRCLDHDHNLLDEPNVRYICCNYCNINIIR